MATTTFSDLAKSVIEIYPQVVSLKSEVETSANNAKREISEKQSSALDEISTKKSSALSDIASSASEKANELSSLVSSLKSSLNNSVAQANEIKESINESLAQIKEQSTAITASNSEAIREAMSANSAAQSIKNEVRNLANSTTSELKSLELRFKTSADIVELKADEAKQSALSAVNLYELTKQAQHSANESEAKAAADLDEIIELNKSIKAQYDKARQGLENTKSSAINDIKASETATKMAIKQASNFHLGRMEFKRRQVLEVVRMADDTIKELKSGSLQKELKEITQYNLWTRAFLECSIFDAFIAKADLMHMNNEVKEMMIETEQDRLEIIRHKMDVRLLAQEVNSKI